MGFGAYAATDVYKNGHLIYGLSPARAEMVSAWKRAGLPAPTIPGTAFIDAYADLVETPSTQKSAAFHNAVKQHPKYGADSFIDAKKYVKATADGFSKTAWMWKRKSKGGIYWATIIEGKTIHFCLDGFCDVAAMKGVVEKNYSFGGKKYDAVNSTGEKARLITGSELRWVFRNRDIDAVQKNIQFWRPKGTVFGANSRDYEQCRAPWEWADAKGEDDALKQCGALWTGYSPRKTYSEADYLIY